MWVHWLNLNTALTFLLVVQPKRPNSANWQHCPRLPTASEDNPNQWSLRACYYAQVSTKKGLPLKSTSDSPILNSWPAEMRTFRDGPAARAAASRFQDYLNSSERKATPKRAAEVAATPLRPTFAAWFAAQCATAKRPNLRCTPSLCTTLITVLSAISP